MTTRDESMTPLLHADGGLEVWVLRDGISGSVLLPDGTWTVETEDADITARIEIETES